MSKKKETRDLDYLVNELQSNKKLQLKDKNLIKEIVKRNDGGLGEVAIVKVILTFILPWVAMVFSELMLESDDGTIRNFLWSIPTLFDTFDANTILASIWLLVFIAIMKIVDNILFRQKSKILGSKWVYCVDFYNLLGYTTNSSIFMYYFLVFDYYMIAFCSEPTKNEIEALIAPIGNFILSLIFSIVMFIPYVLQMLPILVLVFLVLFSDFYFTSKVEYDFKEHSDEHSDDE